MWCELRSLSWLDHAKQRKIREFIVLPYGLTERSIYLCKQELGLLGYRLVPTSVILDVRTPSKAEQINTYSLYWYLPKMN